MAAVPVNVSASVPVKVSDHRKLTGCMASACVPLKAPTSVSMRASASVSLRASASLPVKASAASLSEQKKLSGHSKLKGSKSDYVFIRYAGPDELKSYDKMDFGLFGRSWIANISWSIVFAPGVRDDNWREYLPSATENFMDTGELLDVIASGSTNGVFFADGQSATHAIRTVIPLNELKNYARVQSGGSLLLQIGLMDLLDSGEVSALTSVTFNGLVYWNLYSN